MFYIDSKYFLYEKQMKYLIYLSKSVCHWKTTRQFLCKNQDTRAIENIHDIPQENLDDKAIILGNVHILWKNYTCIVCVLLSIKRYDQITTKCHPFLI